MLAQQSEDQTVMLDTIKSVIESCAKSSINVDTLASFDIEYIFLQLRSVSIGEFVDLYFACDTCTSEEAKSLVRVNLQEVKVEKFDGHNNKINLFGNVGVVMKYPTINVVKQLEDRTPNDIDAEFDIIVGCIDYIYSGEEIFSAVEQTPEELIEFLNNLTSEQFDRIENFFRTMPRLRAYIKYACPVCGKSHDKYMEGLASFF